MSENSSSPLYLQVEEALKDFQAGVARLKTQQTQTDTLLAEGNQALENLVYQIARIEKMREQVESDLRLLERLREDACREMADLQEQVLTNFSEHQEHTRTALDNLKTDFSVRRQELLGLIRDLRQDLGKLEQFSNKAQAELSRGLEVNNKEIDKLLTGSDIKFHSCMLMLEELKRRQEKLEKRNKHLAWALTVVAGLALLTLFI